MKRSLLGCLMLLMFLAMAPGSMAYAQSGPEAAPAPRKSVFARLWELEKRKNAAIMRFLRGNRS